MSYEREIVAWQEKRATGLRKEDSWLTLVNLAWLNEGENRVGSDPAGEVTLPKGKAPAVAGSIFLQKGTLRLEAKPGAGMTANGAAVTSMALVTDEAEEPTILKLGSLTSHVIKRGDRFALRVKDSEAETRKNFKGLQYFPVDSKWRVEARFEPYTPVKQIPIANIIGTTENQPSPGALVFDIDGTSYRLDPIAEEGSDELFVIFADKTSGRETYGAGRYLYTPKPVDGRVVLDFNKAYNPPCAFTDFATCPLPPKQNKLALRVDAGEKKYGNH